MNNIILFFTIWYAFVPLSYQLSQLGRDFSCILSTRDGRSLFQSYFNSELNESAAHGTFSVPGRMSSSSSYSYGDFLATLRTPLQSGLSSFFTCFGLINNPVDTLAQHNEIRFCFNSNNSMQASAGYFVGKDTDGDEEHVKQIDLSFDATTSDHEYTIKWRRNGIQFIVDDRVMATFHSSGALVYPWQNLVIRLSSSATSEGDNHDGDVVASMTLTRLSYVAASNINSFVSPNIGKHGTNTPAEAIEAIPNKHDGATSTVPFLSPGRALVVPYTLQSTHMTNASAPLSPALAVHSNAGSLKVTLTVRTATKSVPQLGGLSYRTRVLCLLDSECDAIAPTLTARPGDAVTITVINTLLPHPANRTSFLLRGVRQTESLLTKDTSGIFCEGGETCIVTFTIPSDAAPGLHWYHSSSALHIMSGMAGAFLIRPANESALPAELQTMQRETLVFSHVMLSRNPSENPSIHYDESESEFLRSMEQLADLAHSTLPMNISLPDNPTDPRDVWLTNGQYQPKLAVRPEEWRIFDILAASGDRLLEIETRTDVGYGAGKEMCRTQLLALDGIYLSSPRSSPPDTNHSHIVLLPGARATVAMSCPRGTHYLQTVSTSNPLSRYAGVGSAHSKSAQLLLNIVASGASATTAALGPSGLEIFRSPYLSSLLSNRTSTRVSISTDQAGNANSSWLGAGTECVLPCFSDTDCIKLFGPSYTVNAFPSTRARKCSYLSVPDVASDSIDTRASVTDGEIVEITIWGRSPGVVPLHFSSPFQLVSFLPSTAVYKASASGVAYAEPVSDRNGTYKKQLYAPPEPDRASAYGQPGDWRDTFPALAGRTTLRGRFLGGSGTGLISAIGIAWDQGMRALVKVLPAVPISNNAAPTPVVNISQTTNSSTAVPSNRNFTVISGNLIDPSTLVVSVNSSDAGNSSLQCDPMGASWGYSETIDLDRRVRVVTFNGCPNHFSSAGPQSRALILTGSVVLPLYPKFALESLDTTCSLAPVGYAVNGVGIFSRATPVQSCVPESNLSSSHSYSAGQSSSSGRTNCSLDDASSGVMFCGDFLQDNLGYIDACGGSSDSEGQYGYRVVPQCLMQQLELSSSVTAPSLLDGFSPQVGWAVDGFPIFGPLGPRGVEMLPCFAPGAHPTLCLDQCNGYRGELSSDPFLYRYYLAGAGKGECSATVLTSNTSTACLGAERCCASHLPAAQQSPYSIGCLVGCVSGICADASDPFILRGVGYSYDPEVHRPKVPAQIFALNISMAGANVTASSVGDGGAIWTGEENSTCSLQQPLRVGVKFVRRNSVTARMLMENPPLRLLRSDDFRLATFNTTDSLMEPDWLPAGSNDAYIFSLAASTDKLFYATPNGVFSVDSAGSSAPLLLVGGIMVVDIFGHNFGVAVTDVFQLLVRGSPCGSIAHVNSSHLQCVLTMPGFLVASPDIHDASQGLVPDQVYVSVQGGDAHGPYLTPETIVVSRSGRPVIASVSFTSVPFKPHAVYLHRISTPSHSAQAEADSETEKATLYFSNVATNGSGLHRCFDDGTQVETLVNIERSFGIAVISADCSTGHHSIGGACDLVVYTHEDGVSAALVPKMVKGVVFREVPHTQGILSRLQSPVGVVVDLPLQRMFVSFKFNTVLRMNLESVFSLMGSSSPPIAVPNSLLNRSSQHADLALVLTSNTLSRLGGLALLPLAGDQNTWSQHRVLVVDMNRNLLAPLTEMDNGAGYPISLLEERGNDGAVLWPTGLVFGPSASGTPTRGNDSITVFVSELLGRIWQVTLIKELDAKAISSTPVYRIRKVSSPKLIVDLSNFPGSTHLRKIANGAVMTGVNIAYKLTIDLLI